MRNRILITGVGGYIGSHLAALLYRNGFDVDGIDCALHGEVNDSIVDSCNYFSSADINQHIDIHIKKADYDAVVHLAGSSSVPDSLKKPYEYTVNNVLATKKIIDNIRSKHIIFAGTSASSQNESNYALSKSLAESVIRNQDKMGWTIFRFFNVSGTDGSNRQLGPATHLIRVLAEYAAGKRDKVTVYGNDYDTYDGTCIRDYIHVMDLCNTIMNAIKAGPANTEYYELGSKQGYSVLKVIEAFENATRVKIPYEIGPRRKGDAIACTVQNPAENMVIKHTLKDMCKSQYELELRR